MSRLNRRTILKSAALAAPLSACYGDRHLRTLNLDRIAARREFQTRTSWLPRRSKYRLSP